MEDLQIKIMSARIGQETTRLKLEVSLSAFKDDKPDRKDIIKSMTESLADVKLAQEVLDFLAQEHKLSDLRLFEAQREANILNNEVARLKAELKMIKSHLSL